MTKSMGPDNCEIQMAWQEANVTALYKNKGEKCDPSNYRHVSLNSVPSKLCEKTVREIIKHHMSSNNLFSEAYLKLLPRP